MSFNVAVPEAFLARMKGLLAEEFPSFLAQYDDVAVAGLRVNTLKISPDDFQTISPIPLSVVPWCQAGFTYPPELQPGKHPYHAAGLYYLQDPSAMAAAEILNPQPGEWVLDLAAAPGGKTTHLATRMQNQGLLIANEIHPTRVWDLAENLERCGVCISAITNETPSRLVNHLGPIFDRVLLDAPCSGEGMFRKSESARREWSLRNIQACATRQAEILTHAAGLVKPGGWLLYSTCTFSPEENEKMMGQFLSHHPDYDLKPILQLPGMSKGEPEWAPGYEEHPLEYCGRLWPQRGTPEGHFFALLHRNGQTEAKPSPNTWRETPLPPEALRLYQAFCQHNLWPPYPKGNLKLKGSYLYQIPAGMPDLSPLKTIHPGFWLGAIKKNRFEPSHAWALTLQTEQSRHPFTLNLDSEAVLAYLRGEVIHSKGQNGWTLIALSGPGKHTYPLGWAKNSQGILKNAYPKGLRWN